MRRVAVFRIRILSLGVIALSLVLIGRLYYVQVVAHGFYEERTQRQYVHTVNSLYSRGTIFMQSKGGEKIAAATIDSGYLLAVNPTLIEDIDKAWEVVRDYVSIDEGVFRQRASLEGRVYVEIEERLTEEEGQKIREARVDGLQVLRNQWRYYPGETVASRIIGFVGQTAEASEGMRGRYGLERYYDSTLYDAKDGPAVNFFAEIFSNLGTLVQSDESKKKGNIVTTIEPTVARMLDKVLQETNDTYASRITGGIIMDPKTGEIRAMSAVPTYNNNDRREVSIEQFQNPLVENVYEMGSIIKALTVAAGLDSKAVTPHTTYYDSGSLQLNTFTIRNFDGRGRGAVDMQEVLNSSLNTGVAFIVDQMGRDNFRDYFMRLQLGSETGIDLPGEIRGLVSNLQSPHAREVEYVTASFGQGIATTPVATVRALAALGNGGYLVTPHLVSKIEYEDGTVKDVRYPQGRQVFSEQTSETVSRMLTNVVDDALRGGTVALPNHTVAAKTGTAQIAKPGGGYYDDRYLHSFFGYFPAYDPKFIIFLYTVEPKGVSYASETLTEPFMELTRFLINYYSVPPDR